MTALNSIHATNGDPVAPEDIPTAVTAGPIHYDDGARQVFEPNGTTTYTDQGRDSRGEWYVDDSGRFCSFWPPSYRACYHLHWIVANGIIVGLTFVELAGGSRFAGRFQFA